MKNPIVIGIPGGVILGAVAGLALKHFGPSVLAPEMRSTVGGLIGGAVCGGFLAAVLGITVGVVHAFGRSRRLQGGLNGAPIGTRVGVAAVFIAQPTEANSATPWG